MWFQFSDYNLVIWVVIVNVVYFILIIQAEKSSFLAGIQFLLLGNSILPEEYTSLLLSYLATAIFSCD